MVMPPQGTFDPPHQTGAVDANVAPITRRGIFFPRWPLLAAIFSSIAAIIGYLIQVYYQSHTCSSAACGIDTWNGALQIGCIWVFFALAYFLSYMFGIGSIETPNPLRHPLGQIIANFFRLISDFEPIRWLLISFSSVAILGLIGMFAWGHFVPVAFAYAVIVIFVGGCVALYNPHPPRQLLTAGEQLQAANATAANPINVFRNNWPFNRLFPYRPPRAPQPEAPIYAQEPIIEGDPFNT